MADINDVKEFVLKRILWTKKEVEESIVEQNDILNILASGRLLLLFEESRKFEFLSADELLSLHNYIDTISERFYSVDRPEQ